METKAWYKSATIQGCVATLLGAIISKWNLPIGFEETQILAANILVIIGVVYTVYGRIKTKGEALTIR